MSKILLGVTGSVAATLTSDLVAGLLDLGEVQLITTACADRFIAFEPKILCQIKRHRDWDEWRWLKKGDPILHIDLRNWADIFVIAPLSANTLGKITNGLCDNLLTSVARAWDMRKPFLVAPAMNTAMYNHPITKDQINKLYEWDFCVIPPIEKELACGEFGVGAMANIQDIIHTTTIYLDGRDKWGP